MVAVKHPGISFQVLLHSQTHTQTYVTIDAKHTLNPTAALRQTWTDDWVRCTSAIPALGRLKQDYKCEVNLMRQKTQDQYRQAEE